MRSPWISQLFYTPYAFSTVSKEETLGWISVLSAHEGKQSMMEMSRSPVLHSNRCPAPSNIKNV